MDNSKEFQLMLDKAIEGEPLAFKDFDRTKNVQDQLQEMVYSPTPQALITNLNFWYEQANLDNFYCDQFTSMEQLWLAFVQKENHNKAWDGDKWQMN